MKVDTTVSTTNHHEYSGRGHSAFRRTKLHILLLLLLLGLAMIPALGMFHGAYAAGSTTIVDQTWCDNVGGTWLANGDSLYTYTTGIPTCELYDAGPGFYIISAGDNLTVPEGTALELVATLINNSGILQNNGAILCLSYNDINNNGTIYNYGHIEFIGDSFLEASGAIDSSGLFYNYGAIGDEFPGFGGIYNRDSFYNYGNDSTPISNNAGATIQNELSGSILHTPIYNNGGTVDNSGTMGNSTVNRYTGGWVGSSYLKNQGGTFNNYGSLTGGFENDAGTVNDYGSMTFNPSEAPTSNSGTFTVYQNGIINISDTCVQAVVQQFSGPPTLLYGDCQYVYLENYGTINFYGYMNNSAGFDVGYVPGYGGVDNRRGGAINILSSATIDNYGEFFNNGVVNNGGTINSYSSQDSCSVLFLCGSTYFINAGTLNNTGTLNIPQGGSIFSNGTLTSSGHLYDYGELNNTGTASNSGYLYAYGHLKNTGTIFVDGGTIDVYTSGTVINSGTIYVYNSGNIYNSGTIENYKTIQVYGSGSIVNSFFLNAGTIHNYKSGYIEIDTDGTLNNPSGATIDNSGTINNNGGTVTNSGTIDNSGLIYNGGTVTNSGTIINECGGQLTGTVNYPYTQDACVTVQVTLTTANSAPSAAITVSGCHVSPTSITADGNPATISADPSCTLTFTVPNDGTNTRYRFNDAGSPSTTWTFDTCASGTCSSESNAVYYQLQNTFSVTINGGNPKVGDTVTLSGSFLGSSSANVLTLDVGGTSSASGTAWTDYGSKVTFPLTTTNSGSGERWALSQITSTPILTAGGSTYSESYAHQFLIIFGYADQDSSGIQSSATIGSYKQFGSSLPISAGSGYGTVAKGSDWVDAGAGMVTYQSYANGIERWALSSSPQSFDVTSSTTTISESSYYHQFDVSFAYTSNDGTMIDSYSNLVTYTQFGGTTQISTDSGGALNPANDWADAGTSVTFASPVSVSPTERYQIAAADSVADSVIPSVSSSSVLANPEYYHQYLQTLSYSVIDSSSPSSPPSASGLQFGSSYSPTLTTTASDYWFDSSGSITFTNPIAGTVGERWVPSPTSIDATMSNSQVVDYYHQFAVTASYSTSDSSTPSSSVVLLGTSFGSSSQTELSTSPKTVWLDSGSSWSVNDPINNNNQAERWDANGVGVSGVLSSAVTVSPVYYHQYKEMLSYSVIGGGNPTPPTFSAGQFGSSANQELTSSPTGYWFDAGSSWNVSPNPLTGSTPTERWYSSQTISGSLPSSTTTTLAFDFYYQFAITFAVAPSGAGSTNPSGTGVWENAGSLSITAAANPGYTFSSLGATGSITFADPSQSSTTATLSGPGTVTANFLINTAITYNGATSGEYSDSITLSATLHDSLGNALSGYTLTFDVGTQSVTADTGAGGVATTTLLLNQPAGSYSVVVSFGQDSTYASSSKTTSFTINTEPATIAYTGTASISTSSNDGTVVLSAQVASELNDAVPSGNITNAVVTFYVYSSNGGSPVYTSSPTPVTETSPGIGTVSLTVSCSSTSGIDCTTDSTYVVYARLDTSANSYYTASDSYSTLVVYTPDGQFITLSGSVTDPNTGSLAQFGGTVRLAHNGVIHGSFIYMVTGACPTGVTSSNGLCDYQFRITAWAGGSLGFSTFGCSSSLTCYASFQGKGVLQVTDPITGALLLSQGNIQITIGAWDNTGTANNGGVDQLTISVVYPQPVGDVASYQVGTVTSPVSISGGGIIVHPE